VRTRLRRDLFDHMNFEPMIGTNEGQTYYKNVYKRHESQYCSVNVKDLKRRDKLMGYKPSINAVNKHEITRETVMKDSPEMDPWAEAADEKLNDQSKDIGADEDSSSDSKKKQDEIDPILAQAEREKEL